MRTTPCYPKSPASSRRHPWTAIRATDSFDSSKMATASPCRRNVRT
ncbi:unnamed protein product, partial [Ixodes persulcatus]